MKSLFIAGPVREPASDLDVLDFTEYPWRFYNQSWVPYVYAFVRFLGERNEFKAHIPSPGESFDSTNYFHRTIREQIREAESALVVLPYESTAIGIEAGIALQESKRIGLVMPHHVRVPRFLIAVPRLTIDDARLGDLETFVVSLMRKQ
jgi:hypothetical protein